MFRFTATLLVVFLVLNHDLISAWRIQQANEEIKQIWDEDEAALQNLNTFEKREVEKEVTKAHSRPKRSWGGILRGGLAVAAGGSFLLSTTSTLYHAIRKCNDYRPNPCKSPTCNYLSPCPGVCNGPATNREYINKEKEKVQKKLDAMDIVQRDAFNLATNAISASLNNKRIMTEIQRINQKVDELMFSLIEMDTELATKFRNKSVDIGILLRNERLSLDNIVASPEVAGLFDKWTWEGTGVFVLSTALPLSLYGFSYLRRRYAISQIYKNLKVDFEARFVSQKTVKNKFAYTTGYSTQKIDSQLKATATALYKSDQAKAKSTTTQKVVNNVVTPLVNAIVIALSVWGTYQQFSACQTMANNMQGTAITMAEKADEVEGIRQTQVLPLYTQVQTEAWGSVKEMMTNETTIGWLDDIRNLTLGASSANETTADTIQHFIDTIQNANVQGTLKLQTALIKALESIDYEYTCLADKQHAITTVLKECKAGRESFPDLYNYAVSKHKLNRASCVADGVMPYTTQDQFFKILDATAKHQGWYSNCLLNSADLLYRICNEYRQGFSNAQILSRVNKTGLTSDMVLHFIDRCPPPEITPLRINSTCTLVCKLVDNATIALTVGLLVTQVQSIYPNCPVCPFSEEQRTEICKSRFCEEKSASVIASAVKLPLFTVNSVISNNCPEKCAVSTQEKTAIFYAHCYGKRTAKQIKADKAVSLPESVIQQVIDSLDCTAGPPNGK